MLSRRIKRLPYANQATLVLLCEHLARVSLRHAVNKMTASNLNLVFQHCFFGEEEENSIQAALDATNVRISSFSRDDSADMRFRAGRYRDRSYDSELRCDLRRLSHRLSRPLSFWIRHGRPPLELPALSPQQQLLPQLLPSPLLLVQSSSLPFSPRSTTLRLARRTRSIIFPQVRLDESLVAGRRSVSPGWFPRRLCLSSLESRHSAVEDTISRSRSTRHAGPAKHEFDRRGSHVASARSSGWPTNLTSE